MLGSGNVLVALVGSKLALLKKVYSHKFQTYSSTANYIMSLEDGAFENGVKMKMIMFFPVLSYVVNLSNDFII